MGDVPRGGKRKGAGRPPLGDDKLVPVEVYVTVETREIFDRDAEDLGRSRSELMREELERAATRRVKKRSK